MSRATYARIERELRREAIPVTLVRGDGYHYILFDNGLDGPELLFGDRSIYIPFLHQLELEGWVAVIRSEWEALDKENEGRFSAWVAAQQQESA